MTIQKTFRNIDSYLERVTTTGWLKPKNLHYACASCGLICGTLFFLAFIASDFLPPPGPWWSAERTAEHYANHQKGIHAGSVLLMFSGAFFLPYTAVISDQMRRIPNIPWVLPQLQLAFGIASTIGFFVPGMQLAATAFRKDRNVELIEFSNDMFWIFAIMPFQTILLMSWAWAYAIVIDNRPQPLYPKSMALLNLVTPTMFLWSMGIHVTLTGPFAWDGALGFWLPLVSFGLQFLGDTYFLFRAIHRDYLLVEGSESSTAECIEAS